MNPPTALTNITVSQVITDPPFDGIVPVLSFKITWLGGDGASFYRFAAFMNTSFVVLDPGDLLQIYITPLSDDTVSSRTATFSSIRIRPYVAIYAINSGGVASKLVNLI